MHFCRNLEREYRSFDLLKLRTAPYLDGHRAWTALLDVVPVGCLNVPVLELLADHGADIGRLSTGQLWEVYVLIRGFHITWIPE